MRYGRVQPSFARSPQLHAIDLNGNGWQDLVSLEGQYDQEGKGGTLTVWKWNGFGFTLEDQVNQYFSWARDYR